MRAAAVDPALLVRFRGLLTAHLGLHFEDHQDGWLAEALLKLSMGQPERLLDELARRPGRARLDQLASELTVGETFFFRHPEQFDALRLAVLPTWLRQRPAPRRLRALSAGCASGEEAYTLAITLQRAGLTAQGIDWQIQGFDLNPAAVARAVAARYREWSLRATPPNWRDLWFRREGDSWSPLLPLRERVRFEQRHIAQPDALFWAPAAFDIIFCRNMLMYLDPATLAQAVQHLVRALAPGGALFIGHAETLRGLDHGLTLRQAEGCFFYQQPLAPGVEQAGWPFGWSDPTPEAATGARRSAAGVVSRLPVSNASGDGSVTAPSAPFAPEAMGDAENSAPPGADASANAPLDEARLLDEALLLIEAGQVEDGLRACAQLMAQAAPPARQADVLFLQALALEERGELPAAEWNHQRAAARDAAFAMPHLRLGLLAQRRGEVIAARRELRRALELLPSESPDRVRRFGGGFERHALQRLCQVRIGETIA